MSGCRAVDPYLLAGAATTGNTPLTAAAMVLMSATSCASRVTFEAVCAGRSTRGIEGVNDHAKDRESGSLDIGRLGADQRRHGFDSGLLPGARSCAFPPATFLRDGNRGLLEQPGEQGKGALPLRVHRDLIGADSRNKLT